MHKSLFIFRQDLRLEDNLGLIEALKSSANVLPIFILDQASQEKFWKDDIRFAFLWEALTHLSGQIREQWGELRVYRGNPWEIIPEICTTEGIWHVYASRSYAPHGIHRDDQTQRALAELNIPFTLVKDFLLVEPSEVPVRKVFTPFFRLWQQALIQTQPTPFPSSPNWGKWSEHNPSEVPLSDIHTLEKHPYYTIAYLDERLKRLNVANYSESRNFPSIDGTSRLSAYLRFGLVSPRLLYTLTYSQNSQFIQELAWREFWYHIAHYFPETYHQEFLEKRRNILWENDTYLQSKIEQAETGYPLVDAAIRQLKETNFMHNRLRMVVASFITKNCLIDWRWWEKFFAKYLLDYDSAVNNGNWQWSASVGADPKPLRIFNPILQSEKFDSEAKFIKKYIPELKDISPKDIHTLNLRDIYHSPIVDQKESTKRAKEAYLGWMSH
jgi:deoxyribodipyrimidine photo-lyase